MASAPSPQTALLQSALEERWGCRAALVQTLPVNVTLDGQIACHVIVHLFDLERCEKAQRAYAWTMPGATRAELPRLFLGLHIGPIKSPTDAVLAALSDERRARRLATRQPSPFEAATRFAVRSYRRRAR